MTGDEELALLWPVIGAIRHYRSAKTDFHWELVCEALDRYDEQRALREAAA